MQVPPVLNTTLPQIIKETQMQQNWLPTKKQKYEHPEKEL